MQASGGRWSSEWKRDADRGGYDLRGNTWVVTGKLGPGTWVRVWPGPAASSATCPYIDVAAVERHFASAVRGRMIGNTCDLSDRQSSKITIGLGTYPQNTAVNDADSIALGRAALSRL